MAYVPESADPELGLVWVDRAGHEERIDIRAAHYWSPRVSPNGSLLAVVARESGLNVVDLATDTQDLFAQGIWPAWTPDARRIAFTGGDGSSRSLMWKTLEARDARPEPLPLLLESQRLGPWVLSFSTEPVVLTFYTIGADRDISVMPVEPLGEPTTLIATPSDEFAPRLSPDARFLAYASDVSGSTEVYVTTCAPCRPELGLPDRTWRVSTDGGTAPLWSADGGELFYLQGTTMMAVSVRTDREFDHNAPHALFTGSSYVPDQFGNQNYDVGPDGRFVMVKSSDSLDSRHRINIVQNWHQELLERVPVP